MTLTPSPPPQKAGHLLRSPGPPRPTQRRLAGSQHTHTDHGRHLTLTLLPLQRLQSSNLPTSYLHNRVRHPCGQQRGDGHHHSCDQPWGKASLTWPPWPSRCPPPNDCRYLVHWRAMSSVTQSSDTSCIPSSHCALSHEEQDQSVALPNRDNRAAPRPPTTTRVMTPAFFYHLATFISEVAHMAALDDAIC